VSWITLKTTNVRWEAELMQQVLAAHDIPSRILDAGIASYFGAGSPAALQVRSEDQWTALLLLSSPEEEQAYGTDNN
jgi:Na+-translocating ferredoxin:NAD+ oxidoreductase RnfC subunit